MKAKWPQASAWRRSQARVRTGARRWLPSSPTRDAAQSYWPVERRPRGKRCGPFLLSSRTRAPSPEFNWSCGRKASTAAPFKGGKPNFTGTRRMDSDPRASAIHLLMAYQCRNALTTQEIARSFRRLPLPQSAPAAAGAKLVEVHARTDIYCIRFSLR